MKQEIKNLAKSITKNAVRFGYRIKHSHALHIASSIAGLANFHAAKETPSVTVAPAYPAWRDVADRFGGIWGSHPDYSVSDWQYEVENDDTRLGYWEWVESKVEQADMEASDEDDDGEDTPVILLTSPAFGGSRFDYESEEEMEAGLLRLMQKVQQEADGVERCLYTTSGNAEEGSETLVAKWDGATWLVMPHFTMPGLDYADHDLFVCVDCCKLFDNDESISNRGDLVCACCNKARESAANVFGSTFWIGNVGVSFEYLGEGHDGDYNPEDPNDEPLLRLDFMKIDAKGEHEEIDGSGCTQVNSEKATKEQRQCFLEMALAYAKKYVLTEKTSFKWVTGHLTWFDQNWDGVIAGYEMPEEIPAILAKYRKG